MIFDGTFTSNDSTFTFDTEENFVSWTANNGEFGQFTWDLGDWFWVIDPTGEEFLVLDVDVEWSMDAQGTLMVNSLSDWPAKLTEGQLIIASDSSGSYTLSEFNNTGDEVARYSIKWDTTGAVSPG